MALAQEPQVLLLDEPTSFLDYYHQLEVMDLLADLNGHGLTIVMAMHDLNQVARYSRRVIALRDGRIFRDGAPPEVLTPDVLRQVSAWTPTFSPTKPPASSSASPTPAATGMPPSTTTTGRTAATASARQNRVLAAQPCAFE